ncbi:hypothetical protein HK098_001773 [Nowakowskiella sp. JEL0407]|nr:hypothetical protein HK098_001773 [Nowakowskiella sp. JEL0407]
MGRQITEEFIDMHLSSSIDNYDSSNSKFVDTNSGSSATPMKVVTVLASDTIEHAVRLLILNNIHSLPVLHPQSQQCLGFIDTGDILSLVVNSIPQFMDEKKFPTVGGGSKKKKREYTVDSRAFGNNIHMEELDDILGHLDMFGRSISKEKVGVLIDASGTDPLFPTTLSTPVVRVLDLFSRGILRVPILASQDALAITQIFSASQMVKYLLQKIHLVPKLAGTEILELKNFDKELVVTTVIKDSVVQALKKLYNNSVHALAIVDTNDRLCGNFSQMDVKGLYTDTIPSLIDPLSSYLARSSPMSLSPVSCDRRTTFSTVVASLVTHKVSQVWVVDDGEKPIGSFSITDACRAVCSFKE